MNKLTRMILLSVTLAGLAWAATAFAAPPSGRPVPPQAAFAACSSAKEGDSCSVSFHEHTIQGTCRMLPDQGLACMPAHPPGPPPEAIEACSGASEGNPCTVTTPDGRDLDGTCAPFGGDDKLACRPAGPPPQR